METHSQVFFIGSSLPEIPVFCVHGPGVVCQSRNHSGTGHRRRGRCGLPHSPPEAILPSGSVSREWGLVSGLHPRKAHRPGAPGGQWADWVPSVRLRRARLWGACPSGPVSTRVTCWFWNNPTSSASRSPGLASGGGRCLMFCGSRRGRAHRLPAARALTTSGVECGRAALPAPRSLPQRETLRRRPDPTVTGHRHRPSQLEKLPLRNVRTAPT